MRHALTALTVGIIARVGAQYAVAQSPEVIGYEQDGTLTFTSAAANGSFTLEFTADLASGQWTNWSAVTDQPITGAVMSLPTPMYFRVKQRPQATAGTIRWTGTDFEGFDGKRWISFTDGARIAEIRIEALTNGEEADEPPGPYVLADSLVEWMYVVENTGNMTLTNVVVEDDQGVSVVCANSGLAPGESMLCVAEGLAGTGQYVNVASVTAKAPGMPDATDSDRSHYFGAAPIMVFDSFFNGVDADYPVGLYLALGDDVVATYVVTNTGNVTLYGLSVSDSFAGTTVSPAVPLEPGQVASLSVTGVVGVGQFSDACVASATPPVGPIITAIDSNHYFGVVSALSLEKHTNGQDADHATGPLLTVGDDVTWSYEISNNGNITVTQLTLTDSVEGLVTLPQEQLQAGEAITVFVVGTVQSGQYSNTASATARLIGDLPPVSANDDSHYFGVGP